ncbi:hypothetical protein ABT096_29870 [Streptomyces sp. NPDC002561]|uniref:hypothetical protein n=1 Tax=Streptomyces sp. NPDC002561 TaxID=3154418 RepID=UPI00331C0BD9
MATSRERGGVVDYSIVWGKVAEDPDRLSSYRFLVELNNLAERIAASAADAHAAEDIALTPLEEGFYDAIIGGHHDLFPAPSELPAHKDLRALDGKEAADARTRARHAAENLRVAGTTTERRSAARAFLEALAELVLCLLRFLVHVLILLLSQLLGRGAANDMPVWTPVPIETAPQVAPRGPNIAFPVNTHRGGHHRSTLGSVVLAA